MIPENLLTMEQIQKAAKESDLAALECSLKHWRQIEKLTEREFAELEKQDKIAGGEGWCSCCIRWYQNLSCGDCPLAEGLAGMRGCCGGLHDAWAYPDDEEDDNEVQSAARAIADYIEKVIKKL